MNEHSLIILKSELEKLNLDPRSLQYRRVQNIYLQREIIIMAHKFMIYKSCFLLSALRRVLGTLANSEDFSRVFKCEPNLKMNPETKCKVWWISIIYPCPCYKRLWQYVNMYLSLSYLSFMTFISRLSF